MASKLIPVGCMLLLDFGPQYLKTLFMTTPSAWKSATINITLVGWTNRNHVPIDNKDYARLSIVKRANAFQRLAHSIYQRSRIPAISCKRL
jgi:hypothetical protein